MQKVLGKFEILEDIPVLILSLSNDTYRKIRNHVRDNMFFCYSRLTAKYKSIMLKSIGDHLDKNNVQNINEADVCMIVSTEEPSEETIYLLDKYKYWYISAYSSEEVLLFAVNKDDQFIVNREIQKNDYKKLS